MKYKESLEFLVLFFNENNQLITSIGDISKLFNLSNLSMKKGISLEDIPWEHTFKEQPDFKEGSQVLLTLNDQQIHMYREVIHNEIVEISSIITLVNLTSLTVIKNPTARNTSDTSREYIIIESSRMKEIESIIKKISHVDSTVLLLGESGVGKSMLAKFIHKLSNRFNKPFVSINCGSIPESLMESELFGYEPGTFTGGKKEGKIGLFEAANEGTIFFDEIAELPLNLQTKLLEVLQERKFRKVGGTEYKYVNIRIITATNKDLLALTKQKLFREDLFYRLNVIPITIPPLRERKEDIPKLVNSFLEKYNNKYGLYRQIDNDTMHYLTNSNWPGNIRELENYIERVVVTNTTTPLNDMLNIYQGVEIIGEKILVTDLIPLKKAKKMLEKELISKAYKLYGSTYKAAKALKVDQSTIAKKIKEYSIEK